MVDTKQQECILHHCYPETHLKCDQCSQELRNRRDCQSGAGYRCRQCPGSVCDKCCKKAPKMEWEDFYNQLMKVQKPAPKCVGCKSRVYPSEGFLVKKKGTKNKPGELVWYCSHSCLEENPVKEDASWGCWAMHPPVEMLQEAALQQEEKRLTKASHIAPIATHLIWVVTGWTEYGDETTDGFIYFTEAEAQAAAKNVTFGATDKGVLAPGNVKTLQSFINDGSALD